MYSEEEFFVQQIFECIILVLNDFLAGPKVHLIKSRFHNQWPSKIVLALTFQKVEYENWAHYYCEVLVFIYLMQYILVYYKPNVKRII